MDWFLYDRNLCHKKFQEINADQKYRKEKDLRKIFSKQEFSFFIGDYANFRLKTLVNSNVTNNYRLLNVFVSLYSSAGSF